MDENEKKVGIEEKECYKGQYRDGDRIYVDRPLSEIIDAEDMAVNSLVLGSLGILFSTLIFGFILGIIAIAKSKQPKEVLNSRHHKYHIATAGMICGWVSIGLSIFFLIYYIAIFAMIIASMGAY